MPQKRATYITHGNDESCEEIRRFIEEAGIILDVRDVQDNPLTVEEMVKLFGHNPLIYFVNTASEVFTELGLDKALPGRDELLVLMAENPDLLRRPIVKSTRLLTVGSNKDKIAEMLQISRNGEPQEEVNANRGGRITRRALPSRK